MEFSKEIDEKIRTYLEDIEKNIPKKERLEKERWLIEKKIEFNKNIKDVLKYPDIMNTKNFHQKLFSKPEFAINKFTKEDVDKEVLKNESFDLSKNQKFLKNFISPFTPYNGVLLFQSVGLGKCHLENTPILMYDGSIKMVQNVEVGDKVMGDDSTKRTVMTLGRGTDMMYDIVPNKGEKHTVNSEHILVLKYSGRGSVTKIKNQKSKPYVARHINNLNYKEYFKHFETKEEGEKWLDTFTEEDKIVKIEVKDYLKLSKRTQKDLKVFKKGVEFKEKKLNFDPYILGLWLGDGTSCSTGITINDKETEIIDYLNNKLPEYDLQLKKRKPKYQYNIIRNDNKRRNYFSRILNFYKLKNNKHIPDDYKINNRENRLKILAGLIDSDGYLDKETKTIYEISQKNKKLAEDILYLVRSLGFGATIKQRVSKCKYKGEIKECLCYRIVFSGNRIEEIPTQLSRKRAIPRKQIKDALITGFKVQEAGVDNYYGFTLDGNHKFLLGDFTVTHNTCSAVQIGESFKNFTNKKILVITPKNLKQNFRKELFDINTLNKETGLLEQCTGNEYFDQVRDIGIQNKDAIEKSVKKIIDQNYEFMGNRKLGTNLERIKLEILNSKMSDSKKALMIRRKIKELYSDRVIIVDEIHSLRVSSIEDNKTTKKSSNALLEILRTADNIKLVLMTATPMFNDPKEIVWIMNLLLANDKRGEIKSFDKRNNEELFDDKNKLNEKFTKNLSMFSQKYVSYMRGEDPKTFPIRLFPSINKDKNILMNNEFPIFDIKGVNKILEKDQIKFLELYKTYMKDDGLQKKVYEKIETSINIDDENEIEFREDDTENEVSEKDLQKAIQISNIVYPGNIDDTIDTLYGDGGFKKIFNKKSKGGKIKVSYKNDFPFLDSKNIEKYSSKISKIIESINNSEGIVFIYSQYIKSGLLPLSIALEHVGYNKFDNNDILEDSQYKMKKKRGNYIVLSGDRELSPNSEKEIEVVKSEENKNGEKIKVILASQVATEGIDFKNIREIHILDPWFNLNRIEQIIGRGVRKNSHIKLDQSKRNTTIYQYVNLIKGRNNETTDFRMWRISERKQLQISKIERVMKQNSLDCNLNKEVLVFNKDNFNKKTDIVTSKGVKIKNYNLNDVPYTRLCDFDKCEFKCNPNINVNNKIEDQNIKEEFIKHDINSYKKIVVKLFKIKNKANYEEIKKFVKKEKTNIDETILKYTLKDLLVKQVELKNEKKLNGFLIYRDSYYIFQPHNNITIDKKITIEERDELDEGMIVNKLSNESSIDITDKIDKKKKKSLKSSNIDEILSKKEKLKKELVKNINISVKNFDKILWDMTIDKLETNELTSLFKIIFVDNEDFQEKELIKQSLLETNSVQTIDDIPVFYNYIEGKLYCSSSEDKFEECDLSIFKKGFEKILEKFIEQRNLDDVQNRFLSGYIEYINSKPKFKMIIKKDNKKTIQGSVCETTSTFTVELLENAISNFDKNIIKTNKLKKKHLCSIYEYVLRTMNEPSKILFLRPFLVKRVIKNEKIFKKN